MSSFGHIGEVEDLSVPHRTMRGITKGHNSSLPERTQDCPADPGKRLKLDIASEYAFPKPFHTRFADWCAK